MNLNIKNIAPLPKKTPKEGQIRVNITIKDLNAHKTYYAQNGSPVTLVHFTFSNALLRNIKEPRFREEFKKLLNILDRHGYEGIDHDGKKGIVKIKENNPQYEIGLREFKLKAPGIDLEIYGAMNPTNEYIYFSDYFLAPLKEKMPNKKLHNRIMRTINRL
jgi:hypothetical protein